LKNKYFKYFLVISSFFVFLALIKTDFLVIPRILNIYNLIISIFLLIIYHISVAYSWKELLYVYGFKINFYDGLSSYGLSNIGKYIPGKIWVSLGEVSYIQNKYSYPVIETLKISLLWQIVSLWTGLTVGLISLYSLPLSGIAYLLIIFFWMILTLFSFTKYFHKLYDLLLNKIFKKKLSFNSVNLKEIIKITPVFFLSWIILGICYFFFISSFYENTDIFVSFCFVFSVSAGYLIFVLPAGIGLREGFLISYFIASGLDFQLATNISVFSRLWFLLGELLIFIIAYVTDKKINKQYYK